MATAKTNIRRKADRPRRFELLSTEIAALCAKALPPTELLPELMYRIGQAVDARGAALWRCTPDGVELLHQKNLLGIGYQDASTQEISAHDRLLAEAATSATLHVPPQGRTDSGGLNPTAHDALLAGARIDAGAVIVAEVFLGADGLGDAQAAKFLHGAARLVAEYYRVRRLEELQTQCTAQQGVEQFVRTVYADLDYEQTAYAIANEAVRMLGCDRAVVLAARGERCRTVAVSGADRVQAGAVSLRRLEELCTDACRVGEPLWADGPESVEEPQLQEALAAYFDESASKSIVVLPLVAAPRKKHGEEKPTEAPQKLGALVIEQFTMGKTTTALAAKTQAVLVHAAAALQHAETCRRIPGFHFLRSISESSVARFVRTAKTWKVAAATVAGVALALAVVPAELKTSASGLLRPATQRVFAPLDGQTYEVLVAHGQQVKQGDVLLRMRNDALQADLVRLRGQLDGIEKELAAVRRRRGSDSAEGATDDLAARQRLLELDLDYTSRSVALHEQRLRRLEVVSPADGRVATWDLRGRLLHRPIRRGQLLLEISDETRPAELVLYVAERDAEFVSAQSGLPVTFSLAESPGEVLPAETYETSLRAEERGDGRFVRVLCKLPDDAATQVAAGDAGVLARIHCGRTSLGYALFHKSYYALRRLWFQI